MVNTLWDSETTLTDSERKLQQQYAKKIVKSIVKRTDNPKDMTILAEWACNVRLAVWREFAKQELTQREEDNG